MVALRESKKFGAFVAAFFGGRIATGLAAVSAGLFFGGRDSVSPSSLTGFPDWERRDVKYAGL
jgi:hypothetical protein